MKYVITENGTGIQHIFNTFTDVMNYIDKWYGNDETSPELRYKSFIEYHSASVLDLGLHD